MKARRTDGTGRPGAFGVTGWVVAALVGVASVASSPSAVAVATSAAQSTPDAGESSVLSPVAGVSAAMMPTAPIPSASPSASADVPALPGAPLEWRPAAFTTDVPDARAAVAISAAMAQIGLPYVWGGNGPTAGHAGFDCSGLTTFAYGVAGVRLPRTAHTQYYAGPHVPAGAPLQPGDLVFYGTPAKVGHVGMYLGEGRIVRAPTFGKPVGIAYYRWRGDSYLGATRPAATGQPSTGLLPYAPAPTREPGEVPPVFEAPPAPLPDTPLPAPGAPAPPEAESAAAAIAGADLAAPPAPLTGTAIPPGATAPSTAPSTTPTSAPAASPATTSTQSSPPTSIPPANARPTSIPPPTSTHPSTTPSTTTLPTPSPTTPSEPASTPSGAAESIAAEAVTPTPTTSGAPPVPQTGPTG